MSNQGRLRARWRRYYWKRDLLECLNRDRATEEITLIGVAAGFGEKIALQGVLDALGDDADSQAGGEGDGLGNRGVVGVAGERREQRTCRFSGDPAAVASQIGQRGITGTKVIQRESDALGFQGKHFFR